MQKGWQTDRQADGQTNSFAFLVRKTQKKKKKLHMYGDKRISNIRMFKVVVIVFLFLFSFFFF